MIEKYSELIIRYMLLLAGFAIIDYAARQIEGEAMQYFEMLPTDKVYFALAVNIGLSLILNVITAVIIQRDRKRLIIEAKHVLWITLIFRELGVCAFLLYAIVNEKSQQEQLPQEEQPA
ncbi:hypothetical protein [Chryseolinea lacunae]|uniref:Uncharacterized protein n=1 Tax=Chryseolinea lacunae TaxID=2801331 RepID=A0ABS1KNT6_9BACT|nr:hypothetical protein [Chryseolinea lacunae]MBL0741091.1 hypothetical protein [Chryseolinea lacunae]